MTRDALFHYLRAHRTPDPVCARCGEVGIAYYRDAAEKPVCASCVYRAKDAHDAEREAILRRLEALNTPTITLGWSVDEVRE